MFKASLKYKRITARSFKPFGWLIDYPGREKASKTKNLFRIVVRQSKLGWRIAYLVVRDKKIDRLEQHPESLETFEPVKGRGILFVSTSKDKAHIACFLLDKPVILKRGIWHAVVTLTREFDIKITENSKVRCVYWWIKKGAGSRARGMKK